MGPELLEHRQLESDVLAVAARTQFSGESWLQPRNLRQLALGDGVIALTLMLESRTQKYINQGIWWGKTCGQEQVLC